MENSTIISSIAKKASAVVQEMTGQKREPLQFIMDLEAFNRERPLGFESIINLLNSKTTEKIAVLNLLKLSSSLNKDVYVDEFENVKIAEDGGRIAEGFQSIFEKTKQEEV